ncbi:sphingomyelin synthase-related protein 1-like isoform X2 [Ostrea edulis]|uniref:sphingomyelin synthase-related protein 1-like isoform X2 n=1 Tax=Ostrea edulis TaxID=37623 RepID=UPI0024AF35EB|nr:sphingomyelin synthase-related protein 1-like isoform X2 [Ostrea edulis]
MSPSKGSRKKAVVNWNCEMVRQWLVSEGFPQYAKTFCDTHKIDGQVLLSLTENDLKQPPLQLSVLGDIKRLMFHIDALRSNIRSSEIQQSCNADNSNEDELFTGTLDFITRKINIQHSHNLDSEIWKTVLSFIYVFTVFLVTAFVMVIVHERVPDVEKYPPLPDIFLDNVPFIPWAFHATELIGMSLGAIWFSILFFHKHRFILMRRMFSLLGTLFLLRSVCMLITSLSVPSKHLDCEKKSYGDMWAKLGRAFEIWSGLGMTATGVRTCGDYMFSGHTVILTILNFFITEYTPRKLYYLHTCSWMANMFGVFLILAAHEHYSIDVFVAFYLTSRLFLYYHTLANNRSLMDRDKGRRRFWFPLFSFFESRCNGVVPNEFEWPIPKLIESVRSSFGNVTSRKPKKS